MSEPWFAYIDVVGTTIMPQSFDTERKARAWAKQAVRQLREEGYKILRAYIVWFCPTCQGYGKVRSKAGRGEIDCPNCHGVRELEVTV